MNKNYIIKIQIAENSVKTKEELQNIEKIIKDFKELIMQKIKKFDKGYVIIYQKSVDFNQETFVFKFNIKFKNSLNKKEEKIISNLQIKETDYKFEIGIKKLI